MIFVMRSVVKPSRHTYYSACKRCTNLSGVDKVSESACLAFASPDASRLTVDGQMTSYGRCGGRALFANRLQRPSERQLCPAGTARVECVLRGVSPIGRRLSLWTVRRGLPVLIVGKNIGADLPLLRQICGPRVCREVCHKRDPRRGYWPAEARVPRSKFRLARWRLPASTLARRMR